MKNIILGVILTLFLFLSIWLFSYFYSNNVQGGESYKITTPYKSDITLKSVATGIIKPIREVTITSQVSGIIDEMFVKGGEIIKKGDPIARIRLEPSPTALNSARSNVELSRLKLAEAKRLLKQQKGINQNELDSKAAQNNFDNAEIEEKKYKKLFVDGVVPELEYNQYKQRLVLAKTALENSLIAGSNSIQELEANLDIARQGLEFSISNLQLLQKGVASKSGQVANIVKSTVDGMVLMVAVEEGGAVIERSNFGAGTIIAEIADMNKLMFKGSIDESDVGKLKKGMNLELTIGAIENKYFDATLNYIAPKGVRESGSVKFEIRADITKQSEVFLRAGYSASADIILDKRKQVLAILERDLKFTDSDEPYVEVEKEAYQFEQKMIKIGLSDGINIEILEGLSLDTKIKVQGAAF